MWRLVWKSYEEKGLAVTALAGVVVAKLNDSLRGGVEDDIKKQLTMPVAAVILFAHASFSIWFFASVSRWCDPAAGEEAEERQIGSICLSPRLLTCRL